MFTPLSSNFCYLTLKTEAVGASNMLVTIYYSIQPHIQEGFLVSTVGTSDFSQFYVILSYSK